MNAGLPPSLAAMVIADLPGAVDAKPDAVDSSTARAPANTLRVVADITVARLGSNTDLRLLPLYRCCCDL